MGTPSGCRLSTPGMDRPMPTGLGLQCALKPIGCNPSLSLNQLRPKSVPTLVPRLDVGPAVGRGTPTGRIPMALFQPMVAETTWHHEPEPGSTSSCTGSLP